MNYVTVFATSLMFILCLSSCEAEKDLKTDNAHFVLEFYDGTAINEEDIRFYDSSTHLLFLKKDLDPDRLPDPDRLVSGFSVKVEEDTIYTGMIYSCILSMPPPEPFIITNCFPYGYDIIEMGYYPLSEDLRNDPLVIHALKENGLLCNGISCEINRINVESFDDHSEASCTITIKNHDPVNYYILDPAKMGELDFNYFTGGLVFQNINTKVTSFLRWSVPNAEWDNIGLHDFSLLKSGSEISFTFRSSDYYKMDQGIYDVWFTFCGPRHKTSEFELIQINGRIWVGEKRSKSFRTFVAP